MPAGQGYGAELLGARHLRVGSRYAQRLMHTQHGIKVRSKREVRRRSNDSKYDLPIAEKPLGA
jgi:hypothetical protein